MAAATIVQERTRTVGQLAVPAMLGVCCLAALALRWYRLDAQSLWLDEGVSVRYAGLGPRQIWQISFGAEPNPPLYFLALWGWIQLWGQSEVAIRSLSAVAGALTVLPAYGLGRSLGNSRAGLLAGLATATSPFLLWYSQEARAFSLLALLAAALLYISLRAAQHPKTTVLALWAATALLVLYTHLYGAFVVAACALWLLAAGRRGRLRLMVAMAIPVVLYLPWLTTTLAHNDQSQNWRSPVTLADVLARSVTAVTHNGVLAAQWAAGGCLVLAVLGLLGLGVRGWRAGSLLGLAILLPLAASYVASMRDPIFSERYIIAIAVPLYVTAALGVAFLSDRLPGFAVLAALGTFALAAIGIQAYQQPAYAKENFRGAAERVAASAQPGDTVLFVADYTRDPFDYYYQGPARLVGFTGDPQAPEAFLKQLVDGTSTIWLLESHYEWVDPQHNVRQWLEQRFPIATEAFPQGIHLRAFRVKHAVEAVPDAVVRPNATFGAVTLAGVQFPPTTLAKDSQFHPPSAWLPVTLYWQVDQKPPVDYRLLLQLVDAKGVWATNLRRDGDLFSKVPSISWPAGKTMIESSDLVLNPAMPPGRYQLQLALLDGSGQPVAGTNAQGQPLSGPLALGDVEIVSQQ